MSSAHPDGPGPASDLDRTIGPSGLVQWEQFEAVLFDLDGVLTPTADLHRRAWAEMFDEFFAACDGQDRFTDADYHTYVDGRPRSDGVRAMLESRGIELPEGEPTDASGEKTVQGLGNRKNELFREVLFRDGMVAFPGSIRVLDHLVEIGVASAVVSSSRNAMDVLRAAGLNERFTVVVDGSVAAADHLAGKPAPDMFLAAAKRLGVAPQRAVVVEDAVSGVEAGRAGNFGLVVGVDRGAGADVLGSHGADLVVTDLAETLLQQKAG